MTLDYVRYYDLERYLFEDVHRRFQTDGTIGAFDFFSIVIWKSNRAKSRVAKRLLQYDPKRRRRLESIVRDLTKALYAAPDPKQRFRILLEDLKLRLPIASAVLSVFWPDEFSVYDVRVCEQLKRFHELADKTAVGTTWKGYCGYLEAVREASPPNLTLRDKDRHLWAKSTAGQLTRDIESGFG